ncbi:kinesin-like protein KIF28P isoform X2 [Artemia franciscana]|uniref:kinesin-like protein KIF28P isoform X2 n=1 Tax=Artemia franciscana TaxID=6661 RepID=UPI0032DB9927
MILLKYVKINLYVIICSFPNFSLTIFLIYNKKESSQKTKNIVSIDGNVVSVTNPSDDSDVKRYTFDFAYWSCDGFQPSQNGVFIADEKHPNSRNFVGQLQIFNDLGTGLVKNALDGYNSTLFAYGQTGSGKSYTVMGYGPNKGIVPLFCESLFSALEESGNTFEVSVSMMEIYNERVRDLFDIKSKKGLRIREHPKKGFYAEGLKSRFGTSSSDLLTHIERGATNRTVAATNLNEVSSRAHTIVGVNVIQKKVNDKGEEMVKMAVVNLVDLAGSERVGSAGSSAERLKEGANINQSLACLGKCIHALAESAQGKQVKVPFRESSLTKLLMNALGGNSRTVMIATISPSDFNYEETLSTLRYADRAKKIKTKAVINEDPTAKLIRDLKTENEQLKKQFLKGPVDDSHVAKGKPLNDQEMLNLRKQWEADMKAQLKENELEAEKWKKSLEEKLKQANEEKEKVFAEQRKLEQEKKSRPHLLNLNADPQLTARIVYPLNREEMLIGNGKEKEPDILLVGPGINEKHAFLNCKDGGHLVILRPVNAACRVLINGSPVYKETKLHHNDRVLFGGTQLWVFKNPLEGETVRPSTVDVTFEYAQQEIAEKAGLKVSTTPANTDAAQLQEDLLLVIPAVEEANSISAELDKRVKFEIVLVAPKVLGSEMKQTQVFVKMKNMENETEFVWPKDKFLARLYLMKEVYRNYEEGEEEWDLPPEHDPFMEVVDTEVIIGTVQVPLRPLAHLVEIKGYFDVNDLKGSAIGQIEIELVPCDASRKERKADVEGYLEDPTDLINKKLHFILKICSCRDLPNRYKDVYCKYKLFMDKEDVSTKSCADPDSAKFDYNRFCSIKSVSEKILDLLMNGNVLIFLIGKQKARESACVRNAGRSTEELLNQDRNIFSRTTLYRPSHSWGQRKESNDESMDLILLQRAYNKAKHKLGAISKVVELAVAAGTKDIPINFLQIILTATTADEVEILIHRLEGNMRNGTK